MMAPPSGGILTKKQLDFNALDLTNKAFFYQKTFCLKMAKKLSKNYPPFDLNVPLERRRGRKCDMSKNLLQPSGRRGS